MRKVLLILTTAIMTVFSASAQSGGKVLILLGHPNFGQSKANKAMIDSVRSLDGVRIMDVYAEEFSLENYKEPFEQASVVVLQFPFYWASAPSEIKRWLDEVFFQLGDVRAGKKLLVATTTISEYEAYRSGGRNGFTMDELLRPYQITAKVAQMEWLTPFALHSAGDDDSVKAGAARYGALIESLVKQ